MSVSSIPCLINSLTGKPVRIYKGTSITLPFQLTDDDDDKTPQDLSSLDPADFKLSIAYTLGNPPDWTVDATFVTDGTDGKIQFALTSAQLTIAAKDAVLELVDNTGSVKRIRKQWRTDILQNVQT